MEVTKDNFLKAYDILAKEIEFADFIAIDGEFTGLSTIKQRGSGYETVEEKYEKTRVGTGRMMLIQYGVSLFTWKEESNHYEAMPFTFYIFPRPYKRFGNDVKFMSQSSSLDFLAHKGFDFNKLFHKGISFMTPYVEEKAKENIEKDQAFFMEKEQQNTSKPSGNSSSNGESKVFIPKDQREFVKSISETVANFMKDKDRQCVDLPPCNPFQRKLIFERIEEIYPLGLYLESATNENNQKFVRGHKTLKGFKRNQEEKYQKEQEMLEEIIGFSKVMKLISKSKKAVVGHNMLLDLFLTITNFFGDAPLNLRDFKEFLSNLFPVIIDTKLMASTPPVNQIVSGTGLENLIDNIEEEKLPKPSIIISEKLKEEAEYITKYHQAGYDAYSTGRIFISMAKCILSNSSQPFNRIDLSSDLLSRYINHVYIMGIRDIISTDLCKEDIVPDRRQVFYIRFPTSWKPSDIKDLFSPYCSLNYPINWINEESAFVTISDDGSYEDIFMNLVMNSQNEQTYYVLPYNYYINNKDPRERKSTSNEEVPIKRKRVDSDVEEGEINSDEDKEATV